METFDFVTNESEKILIIPKNVSLELVLGYLISLVTLFHSQITIGSVI